MTRYLKLYLITLIAFLAIDLLWLAGIAQPFYAAQLGRLMAPRPNWPIAILFYLIFVAGLLYFIIIPGLRAGPLRPTILRAALFGFITYATYDLTNLATLRDWPALLTLVDLAWGTTLCAAVAAIAHLAGRRLP